MKRSTLLAVTTLACAGALFAQGKKILVTGMPPEVVAEFQRVAPGATVKAVDSAQLKTEIADADAILGTINADLVRAGKKLKWAQMYFAGMENVLSPELVDSDIILTNGKIIQGPEIADHAMALLLSLTRGLYRTIPARASEQWSRDMEGMVELNGKTAVIIGVGGIGTQIAVRAHGFGMRVIGVDPKDAPYVPFVEKMVTPERLDEVLPEADVVFISAPHTPKSRGMMGSKQFDLVKKGSYFVAVSRGKVFDNNALVRALDSKRLAGAGLDVTDPEPLPPGHPLWKFENVVITPHTAGTSDRIQERRVALVKENVRRFVAGEPLLNVVDKRAGY
jgi:phosphoglycerate dehydrogenase-like enzyme